ncbi:MAG: OmpA family protein, partial [Chlorobi bacterium]|nr:OmpA family protein [Chlorobiota bacterium]
LVLKKDSAVVLKNEIKDDTVTIENKPAADTILFIKISAENVDVDTVASVQNDNIEKTQSVISDKAISTETEFNKINSVKVYFETAKFNINNPYPKGILQIINFLKKYPNTQISIQGYTDNVGSYNSNIVLAQKRAKAVREFLILKGILPQRLKLKIYGESKPCNTNSTEKGRALNRRVEFKLNTK